MRKATFITLQIKSVEGKPDEYEQVPREFTLPNGWDFADVTQMQCERFAELYSAAIEEKELTGVLKNQTKHGVMVRCAVDAGYFSEHPDIDSANPKEVSQAARFVDAFTTDLLIVPENLS